MNPRYEPAKPPRVPTYEDGIRAEIHAAARAGAVGCFKEILSEDGNRLIKTLAKHEIDALVERILAGYIGAKVKLEFKEDLERDAVKKMDIFL